MFLSSSTGETRAFGKQAWHDRWVLYLFMVSIVTAFVPSLQAQGMLIPVNRQFRPMEIVYQRVNVTIKDQASQTRVEQEFINSQSVPLEAEYLFPLPAGATVNDFAMWVDGKRMKAEMVEAKRARQIYEDIVRRTQDPGLLEQLGNNLWRMRVFPVPAQGRQKVEISFASIAKRDGDLSEYLYPLKCGNQSCRTRDDFTMRVELQSTTPIKSIYSPSHGVGINRDGDHKAIIGFEARQFQLDKDFQLFWTTSDKDVGVSLMTDADSTNEPGVFMLLISPKNVINAAERLPRDIVFVIDTSGSMQGDAMVQAKKALDYCVKSLSPADRFGIVGFSTTTNAFAPTLRSADQATLSQASEWISRLQAVGGTAINDALLSALTYRPTDARNFTVVFLTDGLPTIGETDPKRILANVEQTAKDTRFFVFGVGNEVNTILLDSLADNNRGTSLYVRPGENLEVKMSNLFAKISQPVMSDLVLTFANPAIRITEIFPPKLPDLFHGSQLVVMGRYLGTGATAIKLSGKVGTQTKEIVHEGTFSTERKGNNFLPALWARRKVGYLLDQIRLNGEKKELIDEVVVLAKKFGIVTPYTSYLAIPDQQLRAGLENRFRGGMEPRPEGQSRGLSTIGPPPASAPNAAGVQLGSSSGTNRRVTGLGGSGGTMPGGGGSGGAGRSRPTGGLGSDQSIPPSNRSNRTGSADMPSDGLGVMVVDAKAESGEAAVDYAFALRELKESLGASAPSTKDSVGKSIDLEKSLDKRRSSLALESRRIGSVQFVKIGDLWLDPSIAEGTKPLKLKYLGNAYFQLLDQKFDKNDDIKKILSLGKRVSFKTPSGAVILIDQDGADELTDSQLADLFKVMPAVTPPVVK